MKNFKKIIGYDSIKKELEVVVDMVNNKDKYQESGTRLIKGILFYGEPGTGKTTFSTEFIKACKTKAFTLRKDKSNGAFVKSINDTFKKAADYSKANNCVSIVFLDDMDKYANGSSSRRDCEEYVTIQSCMDALYEKDVLVVATANNRGKLPDSLLRAGRFDRTYNIGCPKLEDEVLIIKSFLKNKNVDKNVNCNQIVELLDGGTCAQLEAILNEAAIIACYEGKNVVEYDHILKAAMRKMYGAPIENNTKSQYERETAYHEAGHALISELLEPGSINLVSVLNNGGDINGFTKFNQNENYFNSKEFMENRVMSLLAGKAAKEVTFGITDVGCTSDLNRAFSVVNRFIDDYCVYGFNEYEDGLVIGSTDLSNRKDHIRSFLMQNYYNKVKEMLIKNRNLLEKIAEELFEKKILTRTDIHRIMTVNA